MFSAAILLWKTEKHPIVLPKGFNFSNVRMKIIVFRREQTAAGINKWASEAALMEQIFLKCQEKEGEPRRFPLQLQCGIWQHKQPYKQYPQNNSWAGRLSAFITTTERESKQTCTRIILLLFGDESHKTGAAQRSSCWSPAANQQCINPPMIYLRSFSVWSRSVITVGLKSYLQDSHQQGFYQHYVSYWSASCHRTDNI